MKRKMAFMAFGLMLMFAPGCRKAGPATEAGDGESGTTAFRAVNQTAKVENGILVFPDQASFEKFNAAQQVKQRAEIVAWEKSAGFTSFYETLNLVTDAEDLNERAAVSGQQVPPHSALYTRRLADGRLKEIAYEDGATTYDFNLQDAGFVHSVNADGYVIIGNKLLQYTANGVIEKPYGGRTAVGTGGAQEEQTGTLRQLTPLPATATASTNGPGYNWSQTGGWRTWDNGKKRVRVAVTGYSSGSGTSVQAVTHQVNVKVEKKNIWGNWVWGNATCCYLYSSWKYRFGLTPNNIPFSCPLYYSSTLSTLPVNYSYPTTYWPSINNLTVNLNPPHATWGAPSGYFFCDAYNVYTYSFSGSVCGGSSGISYSISR